MCDTDFSNYPQQWLDMQADTMCNDFVLSDNREVLLSGNIPDDFINPYDHPEQLEEIRQQEKLSPKQWLRYIDQNFPKLNIDRKKEYKIRKEEVKQERMAQCGEWRYRKDLYHPGATIKEKWRCNQRECPKCRLQKIDSMKLKLSKARDMYCYRLTQEQEKKLQLDKSQYQRIPDDSTGETYYIMQQAMDFECCEVLNVDRDLIGKLSEMAVDCKRRISGTLLGKSTATSSNEENETPENVEEISYHEYKMEFTPESEVDDYRDIDKMVLERLDISKLPKTYTHEFLQIIIDLLEKLTVEVCNDVCVKIHYLSKKQSMINIERVNWRLLQSYGKL